MLQRPQEDHATVCNGQAMSAPATAGGDREITLKPKAIKAHPGLESTMLPYPQMPMYTHYTSPKNPIGVTPFQPTGEQATHFIDTQLLIIDSLSLSPLGGAFKSMPISPKGSSSSSTGCKPDDAQLQTHIKQEDIKQEPPSPYKLNGGGGGVPTGGVISTPIQPSSGVGAIFNFNVPTATALSQKQTSFCHYPIHHALCSPTDVRGEQAYLMKTIFDYIIFIILL